MPYTYGKGKWGGGDATAAGTAVGSAGGEEEEERERALVAHLAWRLADGTGTCTVCLGGFVTGEELRLLPGCGHVFHRCCIDRWLSTSATCPNCRTIVMPAWVVEMVLELAAARQRRGSGSPAVGGAGSGL
ncbi:hypothetical protein VOLCADRAFT_60307 [Volvox carteri f. nagariensis]|uniref:RING-type domain-containing protein n=1 Tax=Volvox carteri f. nagariensis TaxID=3068 RepID=D8TVI7_VOLCA|nr:uncharacterized protein VOLCADRAFT_60307 [Volvox carteri f. nagariensis]EFJ48585.1 hypothetical protein VOLCADRAFT_60307 [Volvox carteri f. nagariensis]|eukprot:XP_002950384.1 hypothetical protein VOLCADRAFT_60307 [Volvox carteri f. nagariensis]